MNRLTRKIAASALLAGVAVAGVACEEGVEEDLQDVGQEAEEEAEGEEGE